MSTAASPSLQFGLRKKLGFLWAFAPPVLPVLGYTLGVVTGWTVLGAWLTLIALYLLLPVVDHWVGEDERNPSNAEVPALDAALFYRALTALVVPMQVFNLLFCGYMFVQGIGGVWGQLGWLISAGLISGGMAITTAHELIHKPSRWERWTGGLLLSSVGYATFLPEHLYGHHRHVATAEDGSTARLNEGVYHFIGRSLRTNPRRGFELAAFRTRKQGHSPWSWRNEMVPLTLATLLMASAALALAGWAGLLFFAGQAFLAVCLLEVINYVEHYGLMRERLPNGRYERVAPRHSWNANHALTNNMLFQLQRHSDHHANGARRYQTLRHFDEAPQLPFGYAAAVSVALTPPLWKRIMNPRVAKARAGTKAEAGTKARAETPAGA